MGWRYNKIEGLLRDIYGNDDNWLDYESNGYHLIGIDYKKKIELLNRLINDINNQDKFVKSLNILGDTFTKGIMKNMQENLVHMIKKEIDDSIEIYNKLEAKNQVYIVKNHNDINKDIIVTDESNKEGARKCYDRQGNVIYKYFSNLQLIYYENITDLCKDMDIHNITSDNVIHIFSEYNKNRRIFENLFK